MAVETARKFLDLIASDEPLQTQFLITAPSDIDEILRFASAKGFIFSADDLQVALESSPENAILHEMDKKLQQSNFA
jgi:predicted ribosomally synthesized peptide with nif11-like leader